MSRHTSLFSIIVTVKAQEQTNQIYSWFKCQRVPFNSWYKYLSTCKQAHLKCASYMFASIQHFNSMYAFSWCVQIVLIQCLFLAFPSTGFSFFFFFLAKCVRIILKQRSESLRASTLGTEIREATPVPCHHPKTELLQNILKCLRDLDTEIKKKKKCEKNRLWKLKRWGKIKVRQIKIETHEEREKVTERERETLDTDHALAQWSTRPCKPPALQTVAGLRQERDARIKHTLR